MIAPSTDIILYKSNLELDNTNQLKFNTWEDQWNYFSNLPHIYLDNATYQRKEGVIRFPTQDVSYDDLIRYNYVSYKNEAYANKTFFAYVKSMRYVNDGMTEIEIETDVFQTWQFDINYRKCFVEREHVKDDGFGKHTVPERLETGEYMYQPNLYASGSTGGWDDLFSTCRVVFAMSDDGYSFASPAGDRQYGGVFSGLRYFALKSPADAMSYIVNLQQLAGGKIDGLYAIFMAPDALLGITPNTQWWECPDQSDPRWEMIEVPYTSTITNMGLCYVIDQRKCGLNYYPRNNKVLCYPYRYLTVSNNAGQTNNYKYEYFKNNTYSNNYMCEFGVDGTLSIGCSIKLFPKFYNNPEVVTEGTLGHNYLEGIDCYKLPTCSWITDAFLNWISTNAVSLGISTATQIASIIGGAALSATGAGATLGGGLIAGGVSGIFSTVASGVEHALEPDTARGGQNSGELIFKRGYSCYCRSIKDEYAKIIDDYFTMFGYKVNILKVPEIHSRENWNYVKTIDCNFSGDIPGDDLVKIREMFNTGFTIWHNPSTFLDYSQSNNII